MLFYVRQKHQDLLTQLAVAIQGYLAMDLVRKNNIELIKGVDRDDDNDLGAAHCRRGRTGVGEPAARAESDHGTQHHDVEHDRVDLEVACKPECRDQRAGRLLDDRIDKLEAAFTNIRQAMDAIDAFKVQALNSMQTTIDTLSAEIQKSQSYLARRADSDPRATSEPNQPEELKIPGDQR